MEIPFNNLSVWDIKTALMVHVFTDGFKFWCLAFWMPNSQPSSLAIPSNHESCWVSVWMLSMVSHDKRSQFIEADQPLRKGILWEMVECFGLYNFSKPMSSSSHVGMAGGRVFFQASSAAASVSNWITSSPAFGEQWLERAAHWKEASVLLSWVYFSYRPILKPQLSFVLSHLLQHPRACDLSAGSVLLFSKWQSAKNHLTISILTSLFHGGALEASFRRLQIKL